MVYCLPGDESPGYYRSSLRDNFRAARRVEFSYQPKSAVVAASSFCVSVVNPSLYARLKRNSYAASRGVSGTAAAAYRKIA